MIDLIEKISPAYAFQSLSDRREGTSYASIFPTLSPSLNHFAKNWVFKDNAITLSRNLINIIIELGHSVAKGYKKSRRVLKKIVTSLKLLSIVNVLVSLTFVPAQVDSLRGNIKREDREGTLLSAASFTLLISDAFVDITFFVNATLEALSKSTIGWISTILAPLGAAILAGSVVLKAHHIYQLVKFERELSSLLRELDGNEINSFEKEKKLNVFLNNHLKEENAPSPLEAEKANATLERHTSKEAVAELKKAQNKGALKDRIALLKGCKKVLRDEKMMESGLLATSLISGIAYVLFLTSPVPVVPLILLAVSNAMELGIRTHFDKEKSQSKESFGEPAPELV